MNIQYWLFVDVDLVRVCRLAERAARLIDALSPFTSFDRKVNPLD